MTKSTLLKIVLPIVLSVVVVGAAIGVYFGVFHQNSRGLNVPQPAAPAPPVILEPGNYQMTNQEIDALYEKKVYFEEQGDEIVKVGYSIVRAKKQLSGTVTIPSTYEHGGMQWPIVQIEENAFANHDKIEQIKLSSTIKKIKKNAFANCTSLKSVEIHNESNLQSLEAGCFASTALYSFTIPESYPTNEIVVSEVFADCYSLVEIINLSFCNVDTKNSVILNVAVSKPENSKFQTTSDGFVLYSHVQNYLIDYVGESSQIVLPDLLNQTSYIINNYAFAGNSKIESITLPVSLAQIPTGLFKNNTTLQQTNIPSGITTIPEYAFFGCIQLNSIEIPNTVSSIDSNAFANSGLEQVEFQIGSQLQQLKTATFANCANLQEVSFGTNSALQELEEGAFENCVSLTGITIPARVTSLTEPIFKGCTSLGWVSFEEGTEGLQIKGSAFVDLPLLTHIIFPARTTSVSGFSKCKQLTRVEFLGDFNCSVAIDSYAFQETNLQVVNLGQSVKTIGSNAFANCEELTSVYIPIDSGLETIGSAAFYNCPIFRFCADGDYGCVIPQNVSEIKQGAFYGNRFSTIDFRENINLTVVNNAFADTSESQPLRMVYFSKYITTIEQGAFHYMPNLDKIVFPDDSVLETIGNIAFCETSITEVCFPATIKRIGSAAFQDCAINSITFSDDTNKYLDVYSNAFLGNPIERVVFGQNFNWDNFTLLDPPSFATWHTNGFEIAHYANKFDEYPSSWPISIEICDTDSSVVKEALSRLSNQSQKAYFQIYINSSLSISNTYGFLDIISML